MMDSVIPYGAEPSMVSKVMKNVVLGGSAVFGKPMTVGSPTGEVKVMSSDPSGVITVTVIWRTLVIFRFPIETDSMMGEIDG